MHQIADTLSLCSTNWYKLHSTNWSFVYRSIILQSTKSLQFNLYVGNIFPYGCLMRKYFCSLRISCRCRVYTITFISVLRTQCTYLPKTIQTMKLLMIHSWPSLTGLQLPSRTADSGCAHGRVYELSSIWDDYNRFYYNIFLF